MHYDGAMTNSAAAIDQLATPVAWLDADGRIEGVNTAFASWLGVSARRLHGLLIDEIDSEGGRLSALLPRLPLGGDPIRVHRARLAFPGGNEHFAQLWLAARDEGGHLPLTRCQPERLQSQRQGVVLTRSLHDDRHPAVRG